MKPLVSTPLKRYALFAQKKIAKVSPDNEEKSKQFLNLSESDFVLTVPSFIW